MEIIIWCSDCKEKTPHTGELKTFNDSCTYTWTCNKCDLRNSTKQLIKKNNDKEKSNDSSKR